MIKAQDYILQQLNSLAKGTSTDDICGEALVSKIKQIILSKKFRKYSASEALKETIHKAICHAVEAQAPIQFLFPQGAYKLWRLVESPNVDWAELFFLMHVSKPLAKICAIYKPGVVFDFFVDDVIMEKMNNLPRSDVEAYIISLKQIIGFLKKYLPDNLNFKITGVSELFDSEELYWEKVNKNLEIMPLPELTEKQKRMIEMNVRLKPGQDKDPKWREKVLQIHNAHMGVKKEPGYHLGRDDKVLIFTTPLKSGAYVSVGTTKSSVAKHWCGVGALAKEDDDFDMIILPPSKIPSDMDAVWEKVNIPDLEGDNFSKIRIVGMKKAYLVYPGLGKTTLMKKNPKVMDIETKIFKDASLAKYIGKKDYPNYRGQEIKEVNPEYPENRNKYAREQMESGKVLVMVPKQDSYDLLEVLGISDYAFIMPDMERLKQLEQDYIKRGDDAEYIKRNLTDRYEQVLALAKDLKKEVIFVKPNEYLEHVFNNLGD